MSFSKSCVVVFSLLMLAACTSKTAPTPQQSEAPVAATQTAGAPSATGSKQLPHFSLQDAGGNTIDIQSFKGKKVFVNLWATWCPPCRAEMPSIDKLYQAANKENVQFVMVSLDNDFETAKAYVQKMGFRAPIYYPATDLPELFAVNSIPTTFIFDETGTLIEQREGSEDYNTASYRTLFGAN